MPILYRMRCIGILFLDLLVLATKLLGHGGIKAVIAENLLLKHQLSVIGRTNHRAPNLKFYDRITLGWLSLLISPKRLASVAIIIQPVTLLKFYRALIKRKYQRLFGRRSHKRPGPKGPSKELIAAIVELKQRNPRHGCPRIAEVVFGIPINKDIVRRILARHYKPVPGKTDGPSWLTLIGHSRDSLWSRGAGPFDLFRCESLTVQSYWVLVVMDC